MIPVPPARPDQGEPPRPAANQPCARGPAKGSIRDHNLAPNVRHVLRARRAREKLFPNFFADPAWDILLEVFLAMEEGRALSISSACLASTVPQTTALRVVQKLEAKGHVRREQSARDRRRWDLSLSAEAYAGLRDWLERYTA